MNAIRLAGCSTEDIDGDALRIATDALLDAGLPRIGCTVLPLADAARARAAPHALLESRQIKGRVVLDPGVGRMIAACLARPP